MADAAYRPWPLVVLNTALFALFAISFFHPKSKRDWRAMGAVAAFLVALFTEMYGTPLTIYLLGSWLGSRFLPQQPQQDLWEHWPDLPHTAHSLAAEIAKRRTSEGHRQDQSPAGSAEEVHAFMYGLPSDG